MSRNSTEDCALAEKFLQQAINLDQSFGSAYAASAMVRIQQADDFQTRSLPETSSSIEALARRAVALDGADAEAHSALSSALRRRADYDGALAEAARALAISPNLAFAHHMLGATLIFSGRPNEGLASIERSIRLDPRHPGAVRLMQVALALYVSREYTAAVEAAKRAIRSYPDFPNSYRWLAAALGQLGRTDEAKEALAKAIEIVPASFEMYVSKGVPWMRPEDHAHMLDGLRKAGWQE
jgi:adenylate cyclase